MVTLLVSWLWSQLPAPAAGHPGAILQAMTCADAGLNRTCNTCLQLYGPQQDMTGYCQRQARSRVAQRGAYSSAGFTQIGNSHGLLAPPRWTLSSLIAALDRMLTETDATDWPGQVRSLNQWRSART